MVLSIKSVEINKFRSLRKCNLEVGKIGIFVGKNDAGKSNILRALNLFFNDEVDKGKKLNLSEDFNFNSKRPKKADKIEITVRMELPDSYREINGDEVVWTKVWQKDKPVRSSYHGIRRNMSARGKYTEEIIEIPAKSNVHSLLSKVEYRYIPAIKSGDFFNYLRGEIYKTISRVSQVSIRKSSSSFEKDISSHLSGLMEAIQDSLGDKTKMSFPKDLINIFERLDFLSGDKEISLDKRGDGVKSRYIPLILSFLAEQEKKLLKKGSPGYSFIWGYEEPENNLEIGSCEKLSKEFLKLAGNCVDQILLTTHSPIFYNMRKTDTDGANVSVYHIIKESVNSDSEVVSGEDKIDEDLGTTALYADKIWRIQCELDEECRQRQQLEKELCNARKPILYVEDKYDEIYKIIWLKLHDFPCNKQNFKVMFDEHSPFKIIRAEGASCLAGMLRAKNIDMFSSYKIVGLFDFDEEGRNQFKACKNSNEWKNSLGGTKAGGIYLKRQGHPCFCVMLLPIPPRLEHMADLDYPSFVEIENLLPENFLRKNSFVREKTITGGVRYLEIISDKKFRIWEKVSEMNKDDLSDYKPLFEQLETLWGL